jgi:hypothetical protein
MAGKLEVKDDLLEFTHDVSMAGLGEAMKAYNVLVISLGGDPPKYTDFTAFLKREGYAKPAAEKVV